MKPFYSDDLATLYHGDALKVLAQLPDNSVDAVITDPPYSSGGATQSERKASAKSKYESSTIVNGNADFVGDQRDQRAYQYWSALWMGEALRICKPSGFIMAFTDWRQYAATADSLQAGGWTWRGTITWSKGLGAERVQKGRFAQSSEFVLWGTKGAREIDLHGDAPTPRGHIEIAPPRGRNRVHITEKPEGVMRHLMIPLDPHSVILDPFAGSCTTGVAAKSLGHRFIGIEQTRHYCEVGARRLAQDAFDLGGIA